MVRIPLFIAALLLTACGEFGVSDKDEVVQEPIKLDETFIQAPLPKLDVLWVIDDTPSMSDEQAALSDALGAFTDGLDDVGLAWQIGVIRTDISGEDAGILQGMPWVITPALEEPGEALASASEVGLTGQPPEAGLAAAWLALTDPLLTGANRGFRRSDAALHIVVVSDGDDASEITLGGRPDEAFTLFLSDEAQRTGQPAALSAVVGDTPDGCAGEWGSAQAGTRYVAVAQATDGVVQSICDPDFSEITTALGRDTVPWPVRFELTQRPVRDSLRVAIDERRQDDGWTLVLDPPAIVFDLPPAAGVQIRVQYEVEI